MTTLPTGTVTFLFTDIEGSTRLLQRLGAAGYALVRDAHHRLLRETSARHGGMEVDTQGDAFFLVFPTATGALDAAAAVQRAFAAHPWPDGAPVQVRMGLHTGTPLVTDEGYVGLDVVRAARIAAAGHGGQVLLSQTSRDLVEQALPEGASLRDLGVLRLKDLQQPEHVYQLVLSGRPADYPPPKTLDRARHNLLVQPTPLLGREREVGELTSLLRRDEVRLVTLTGTGGTGKTRLGQQVAAELADAFPDGVWFVRLARLSDPTLVLPTIAQTLGLQDRVGRPPEDQLGEYLREKHLLLLLDNFEQLVAEAAQVGTILADSPRLKLLVTSRAPLHLRGEKEYRVAPLALPPMTMPASPALPPTQGATLPGVVDQLTQYAAAALFIQRALDARPDFAVTTVNAPVVAEICARLDGLPLAIELAAARVKLLPPQQLLKRLERRLPLLTDGAKDLLEHQQTMQATLAWSEELLTPAERVLFRRLAVFVGGCTLEAAEAVCAAPESTEPLGVEVLDGLGRLVDQSLVQQREEGGEARFSLLQVVREYAFEQLEASGESQVIARAHARYYLRVAEQAELEQYGSEATGWLARLERELDNLRAAMGWARGCGEEELGLRMAEALTEFWHRRGYLREGLHWLEELLALAPSEVGGGQMAATPVSGIPVRVWVRAMSAAGQAAANLGDYDRARVLLEQSLEVYRELGNQVWICEALTCLAYTASRQGNLARATALCEECLVVSRQARDPWHLGLALANLADAARRQGSVGRAATLLQEALPVARTTGNNRLLADVLGTMGMVAWQQEDAPRALTLLRQALSLVQESDTGISVAEWLVLIGWALGAQGLRDQATPLLEQSARLLGAAVARCEVIGYPLSAADQPEHDRIMAHVRTVLGEEVFAVAWEAGRVLTLQEAIAEALGGVD